MFNVRKKIMFSVKKISKKIQVTHSDGTQEIIWGISNVAKKYNFIHSTVSRYMNNGKTYKGYKFVGERLIIVLLIL